MKYPFRVLYRGHVAPGCEYANSADSPHLMSHNQIQSLANEYRDPFILVERGKMDGITERPDRVVLRAEPEPVEPA